MCWDRGQQACAVALEGQQAEANYREGDKPQVLAVAVELRRPVCAGVGDHTEERV